MKKRAKGSRGQLTLDQYPEIERMTLAEIDDHLKDMKEIPDYLRRKLADDNRRGTDVLLKKHLQQLKKRGTEEKRLSQLKRKERQLRKEGYQYIAGVDESGRGALAGPVLAAAVIMPAGSMIRGLDDGKRLSPKKRRLLYEKIKDRAIAAGVGSAGVRKINDLGIISATRLAMERAIIDMERSPDYILIDGSINNPGGNPSMHCRQQAEIPCEGVKKGDRRIYSIAAASILAKVKRDREMKCISSTFPGYKLDKNKGYGTPEHRQAVEKRGYSDIHRQKFRFHRLHQLSLPISE